MAPNPTTMKALRAHPPIEDTSALTFDSVPVPTPPADSYLLKIHAAGIIATEITWGDRALDPTTGDPRPFVVGRDFAGVVVEGASGPFSVGDEVFAMTGGADPPGTVAEFTHASAAELAPKPRGLSMAQAAAVPLSALTAWQALFVHAGLPAPGEGAQAARGKRVLVTGAAGGTGVWAVQMAKAAGAYVVGSASSGRSFEILRRFGVDEVVNYREQKLDPAVQGTFDVVLDTVGGATMEQCWGMVKKGGWITSLLITPYTEGTHEEKARELGVRANWFIVEPNAAQLKEIAKMIEAGKLETTVDKVYAFDDAIEAYKDGLSGRVHGKLVVEVSP